MEELEVRCVPSGVAYGGGPILQNALLVPIFYGSAWTSQAQSNEIEMLDTFLQYLSSRKNPLMTFLNGQYNVTRHTSGYSHKSYTIGSASLWPGNSADPTGNDVVNVNVPKVLIDSTYASIITDQIAARRVPAATANTLYIFFSPPGTKVFDSTQGGVPVSREWYGYHFAFADSTSSTGFAYYIAVTSPGNAAETLEGTLDGVPLNVFQSLTEILTHEVTEAITDPNSDDSGWSDPAFPDDGEIADMGLEPTASDQNNDIYQPNWLTVLNDYAVPQLWSNKARGPASLPGAKPATTTPATTLSTLKGPTLHAITGVIPAQNETFSWSSVKNANWYEFELEDVTVDATVTLTTSKISVAQSVSAGHTYKWMVRAFSDDGVMGHWSNFSQFNVGA
jgi:hypothetical protein